MFPIHWIVVLYVDIIIRDTYTFGLLYGKTGVISGRVVQPRWTMLDVGNTLRTLVKGSTIDRIREVTSYTSTIRIPRALKAILA